VSDLSVAVKYFGGHSSETDRRAARAVGRSADHSGYCFLNHERDLCWNARDLHEAELLKGLLKGAGFESAEILLLGDKLQ
jgi:hypothetical protein